MTVKVIHDPNVVYEFLKDKVRYNYIYQWNNLEPEIWEKVICYGLYADKKLIEIAMLNMNYEIPVLLAAGFEHEKYSVELVDSLKSFLPASFYTHINKSILTEVFSQSRISEADEYINMGLTVLKEGSSAPESLVSRLGYEDLPAIKELLSISYPEAWLDDELVRLNENFGIYRDEHLISFAGIHAYSLQHQVAAVAHVTTQPAFRGNGYAGLAVAALVQSLAKQISYIGLNVKADNFPAIHCYKKLGFEEFGRFAACEITGNCH